MLTVAIIIYAAAMTLAGDGLARKAPWATSGPAFRTTPAWPAGQHRSVSP